MSDIFDRIDVLSKVSPELKKEIKFFHIFNEKNGNNVLFITSDDKVYGFGANYFGGCGLGHNTVVEESQVIQELCDKNIIQFFIGESFVLAFSSDHQLYGWGQNDRGQLATDCLSEVTEYLRPQIITIENEIITVVSCGSAHTLALTLEGKVYGWGHNNYGQTGCGQEHGESIHKPTLLKGFENVSIKSIYCSYFRSYALTTDGCVYGWGFNDKWCDLGHDINYDECVFEPKLINISNVISVGLSTYNTYFLTNERLIYFCGYNNHKTPTPLNSEMRFSSLHFVDNNLIDPYQYRIAITTVVSEDGIHLCEYNSITKIENKTLFEYFWENHKTCYKTLEVSNNQIIDENDFPKTNSLKYKIKEVNEKSIKFSATDLKNIIQRKREYFGRQPNQEMNTIEYFISCQLFKEVLECVQYLHESNPPLIHGNLRPDTISVFDEQTKGRFLKMGSIKSLDENSDKIITKEEIKYLAPELNFDENSKKSDIYSLAVIAMDIFDFNIYKESNVTKVEYLNVKWEALKKVITNMMNNEVDKRSDCCEILSTINEWSINLQQLCDSGATDCLNETKVENNFVQNYFNTRLMNEIDSNIFDSKHFSVEKSDIVFIVKEERVQSFRLILMIKNKAFQQMFSQCNDQEFIVNDLNPEAFKLMLQYIYWNKISTENSKEHLALFIDVYRCAERYQVTPLMVIMEKEITNSIDFQTMEAIYKFAKEFNLDQLKSTAQQFLKDKFEDTFSRDEDELIRINDVTDNYLFRLNMKYSSDKKNECEKYRSFLKPSGSDSVVINQVEYTRVKSTNIDGKDPKLFGVKYLNLSTDLIEN